MDDKVFRMKTTTLTVADFGPPFGVAKTKLCTRCNKVKSLTRAFYRSRRSSDGHQTWCKPCQRADPNRTGASRNYESAFVRTSFSGGVRVRVPRALLAPVHDAAKKLRAARAAVIAAYLRGPKS